MNTSLKIGAATLLLLGVALSVALIVTILSNENAPSDDDGTRSVAVAKAQTPAAPENDATYGLDLDKQTVARSKAILDERERVSR